MHLCILINIPSIQLILSVLARIHGSHSFLKGILMTPKEGSKCVVYAAVSPDMKGRSCVYLKDCKYATQNSTTRYSFLVFSGQLLRFCELKFVCTDVPFYAFQKHTLIYQPFLYMIE